MALQLLTMTDVDLLHHLDATTAGTAGYGTLLGISAPKLGTIGGDTFFTGYTFPTSTLGLTAGQDITVVVALYPDWDGNDGTYHWLFSMSAASGANRFYFEKESANVLRFVVCDSSGNYYYKQMTVNGTNMAANTTHIIMMTRDSATNTINGYLNGTAATTISGTARAESSISSTVKVGQYPFAAAYRADGRILCAVFDRVLSAEERTAVNNMNGKWNSWLSPNFIGNLSKLGGTTIGEPRTPLPGIDVLHKYAGNG